MCKQAVSVHNQANSDYTIQYRLKDFFELHWKKYINEPGVMVSIDQLKAATAIMNCRTAALGSDQYLCESCGEITEIFHNCRHRFCPTCSWRSTMQWAEELQHRMLNLPHRHIVFTLPHRLIGLIKSEKEIMLNLLLRIAADTLKDWIKFKYGLSTGIVSVLHTAGERKTFHPHVHMLVAWGGIDKSSGRMIKIESAYIDYEDLADKFKENFRQNLLSLFNSGVLNKNTKYFKAALQLFSRINIKKWAIKVEPMMDAPKAVIRYIGRYSKRACISERKITSIDGEYISFRFKNNKVLGIDKKPIEQIERLHYREFFPRLLQHVPLKYFRLVRYYGVYATCVEIPEIYTAKEIEPEQENDQQWEDPFICKHCNKRKIYINTVFDRRPYHERNVLFNREIHECIIFKRA